MQKVPNLGFLNKFYVVIYINIISCHSYMHIRISFYFTFHSFYFVFFPTFILYIYLYMF